MADAEIVPEIAVMVTEPAAIPVVRPVELTVAKLVLEEAHLTDLVTSFLLPSE